MTRPWRPPGCAGGHAGYAGYITVYITLRAVQLGGFFPGLEIGKPSFISGPQILESRTGVIQLEQGEERIELSLDFLFVVRLPGV